MMLLTILKHLQYKDSFSTVFQVEDILYVAFYRGKKKLF